jgi:ABC-type phosphate/phosphonate transport system substrate-binding protein
MPPGQSLRFGLSRSHAGGGRLLEGAHRLAAALSARAGRTVRSFVVDDYDRLLHDLLGGAVDVAWMPPLPAGRALAGGASVAAVCRRDGQTTYRAALLVRLDDPVAGLGALSAARAAWTDPESASGHLFPRLHLRGLGLDLDRALASERFFGSATAACAAVANGEADLCACPISEAHASDEKEALRYVGRWFTAASWRLRVLGVTDSIPPDGFVMAPKLPAWDAAALGTALRSLHEDPAGREVLEALLGAERCVAPSPEILALLRQLA